ncbi:MAG: hypothetical protein JXA03_04000 [Bacteroidales bacterium]|nr:hypothetical protein [Bacteroidales bacterium]
MKRLIKPAGIVCMLILFAFGNLHAQGIIKKLKEKTEDKVIEKVFKEDEKSTDNPSGDPSSGKPANTKGEGLRQTIPDVNANITEAASAWNDKKYTGTRYAVRQAILGIELEIGNNILSGLPESIDGLPAMKEEDNVTSSGIGFVGMVISRVYRKDDKEFRITIGNDAAMLSAVNMYLASGAYATSTDQNYKQVKYKDYPAVLEFDEYSGYTLSVPFGQSSVMVAEGVNFENEDDIMGAAENIDIEKIKKELGEQ